MFHFYNKKFQLLVLLSRPTCGGYLFMNVPTILIKQLCQVKLNVKMVEL